MNPYLRQFNLIISIKNRYGIWNTTARRWKLFIHATIREEDIVFYVAEAAFKMGAKEVSMIEVIPSCYMYIMRSIIEGHTVDYHNVEDHYFRRRWTFTPEAFAAERAKRAGAEEKLTQGGRLNE